MGPLAAASTAPLRAKLPNLGNIARLPFARRHIGGHGVGACVVLVPAALWLMRDAPQAQSAETPEEAAETDDESSMNLKQAAKLYDAFLEQGLDRRSALVALGGGLVGDLTG